MAPRRLLILTNAELGAANVLLATLHGLLEQDPELEMHVVSFAALAPSVEAAVSHAVRVVPGVRARPVFHALPEHVPYNSEAVRRTYPDLWDRLGARPGWRTGPTIARLVSWFFAPWEPDEYEAIYSRVVEVVGQVKPDLALVDPVFGPGLTACRELGVDMCHIAPNSLKDLISGIQPHGAVFWKYPM